MRRYRREDIEAISAVRAEGYLVDILDVAKADGEHLELSEEDFARLRDKYSAPRLPDQWPVFARVLSRLRNPTDAGVGDTVARVIGPVGGDAYKVWFERLFGKPCHCLERQDELNRRFPYVDAVPPL